MNTNKLHNIKETGFSVPKDYFELLEDAILSNVKLKDMASESGFKIPDNYFDSSENNIINNLNQQKEVKVISLFTWRKAAYVTAVAASLILMINIFFNKPEQVTIESVETASIENYFIEEDLGTTEFASLFTKEDLQDVQLISDGYNSEILENFVFDNLEIEDIITK